VLLGSIVALTAAAVPAFAGTVTQPTTNPIVVPASAGGAPYSFTVQGSGFEPGSQVYIEQCDGTNPSDVFWDPTLNCDLGSSPAPAAADAGGNVTFGSNDLNHKFTPFKGTSPQGLFDCLAPNDPASVSGNPSFSNCKVRLSTNNSAVTSDQVFFAVTLPSATPKVNCKASGSLSFIKPLTNVAPKKPKATKIKGAGTLGSAAGTACTSTAAVGTTKYPVSSGSVKIKGSFPSGSKCSVLGNPTMAGTAVKIKWQGINPKNGKLSTAGKSEAVLANGTVAAIPTGGWVASGTITVGNFVGSTVRVQLALNGGVTGETGTCNGGSLGAATFTSASSLAVL
jgi:hypothetical protein